MNRSRLAVLVCSLALGFLTPGPAGAEEELGWYDWIAVAPEVAVVDVIQQEGKFVRGTVLESIRGALRPGDPVWLDQRIANRERNDSQPMLRLHTRPGAYVALMETVPRPGKHPAHRLVRGVESVREFPKEGGSALVSALREFAALQDETDFSLTWIRFADLLDNSRNPIILEGVLGQFAKFRLGDPELVGTLEPLLDHPRATVRRGAATVVGIVAERNWETDAETIAEVQPLLMALARRDRVVSVRVAATRSLLAMPGDAARIVLEEIAREDPEQAVRYEAERVLYEWRADGVVAGSNAD